MAGFLFPPFDASGSTGFLDPQMALDARASLLTQPQAAPSQGFNWGSGSSMWPMLMSLGAGIASGGAKGGGGWGAGIGKGLALGMENAQNTRENDIKERAYQMQLMELQNNLRHQRVIEGQGETRLGIESTQQAGLDADRTERRDLARSKWAAPLSLISGAAPGYVAAKTALTSSDFWGSLRGNVTGGGEFGKALIPVKQMIVGLAELTGRKPEDLYATMLPTNAEDATVKLGNLEAALGGLSGVITDETLAPAIQQIQQTITTPAAPTPQGTVQGGASGPPIQAGAGAQPRGDWQTNPQARSPDQLYTLPNGQKAYWRVFPGGQTGWEPIQ
jgi:hypothetical protein